MSDNKTEPQEEPKLSTEHQVSSISGEEVETAGSSSPAIIETTVVELPQPPLAVQEGEEDTCSTKSGGPAPVVSAAAVNVLQAVTTTVATSERQIAQPLIGSTEGVMPNGGNGSGNSSSSNFRSAFNGRAAFARILSSAGATTSSGTINNSNSSTGTGLTSGSGVNPTVAAAAAGTNLSSNIMNDLFAFVQRARNPSSLFLNEQRRSLFLSAAGGPQAGRPLPPGGTNSPPIIGASAGTGDVVIELDNPSSQSHRLSSNEIYPISSSSSIASGIRPGSWGQPFPGSTADDGPSSSSSIMPNFNYHHHHHHFHNHQPLLSSVHQHHIQHPLHQHQQQQLQQQTLNGPDSVVRGASSVGNLSGHGVEGGAQQQQPGTPTTNPPPFAGTSRSNSIISSSNPGQQQQGAGSGGEEATVHEALNQIPEARAMMETLARYIPLLFILVTKLCYDHLDGIIHFLALLMAFSHANWIVRQEISKQAAKRIIVLLRELVFIVVVLAVVGLVLERKHIFLSIMFMPDLSDPQNLKALLFSVVMSDLVLKLLTIAIKLVITMMPQSVIEYKSRGKIYLMTESLSQLYRAAAPIQPWLIFLFESYSGSEKIVGVILSVVYMVAKSSELVDRIKFCKRSVIKLLQKTSYGTIPSKEQLQACGGQCPICHDNFNSPVLLECNHIFCELCVGTWFDREQTCPLCRAKIVDDPSYRDGATTFFLQLY